MDQGLTVLAAKARDALKGAGEIHGTVAAEKPRYELFHAPNSICSQKVRAVLAHHGLPYISNILDIFAGQTYLPEYVRLRMRGCERYGGKLVSRHTGSTSTAAGGCDGAVVPTLIDWQAGEVIVDSKRICLHLDDQVPDAGRLRPKAFAAAIDRELETVDNFPNYQMLVARTIDTEAGNTRDAVGAAFVQSKVAICTRYLAQFEDDEPLAAAYTAKRAKELSAANDLFSPTAMRLALDRAETALDGLEQRLSRRRGRWLFAETVTMADLFWAVELLRIENIGGAKLWTARGLARVAQYLAECRQMEAIKVAVTSWPGAMF